MAMTIHFEEGDVVLDGATINGPDFLVEIVSNIKEIHMYDLSYDSSEPQAWLAMRVKEEFPEVTISGDFNEMPVSGGVP